MVQKEALLFYMMSAATELVWHQLVRLTGLAEPESFITIRYYRTGLKAHNFPLFHRLIEQDLPKAYS